MAKDKISVNEFLKRQAELEQERLSVIAQLEAEIKEKQDLIAQLKGESPKPVKKPQGRAKAPLEAAREAEIKITAELPNEAEDIATIGNGKRKTQRLEGLPKPDGPGGHG